MTRPLAAVEPPPPRAGIAVLLRRLFGDWRVALASLAVLALAALALPGILRWTLLDATFGGGAAACEARAGACWVFVGVRLEQFVYGFYPAGERWRVDLGLLLLVLPALPLFLSRLPRRGLWLAAALLLCPPVALLLFSGGALGLALVPTNQWGGLFVTLLLSLTAMAVSLPCGVLLAVARRSGHPVARPLAAAVVEIFRGVPLIAILFMAVVMLPLFMPDEGLLSLFARVMVGLSIYASAYMAEVMRGALLAVPVEQDEGAAALGLRPWQRLRLVVLPQALRVALPNIVNTFVQLVKDTTLVLIIGVFDLLGMVQVAVSDPQWLGRSLEGYVFAGAVYFCLCFGLSSVSRRLERRLQVKGRRT
jgi:general L-amino acid transport system permease protein